MQFCDCLLHEISHLPSTIQMVKLSALSNTIQNVANDGRFGDEVDLLYQNMIMKCSRICLSDQERQRRTPVSLLLLTNVFFKNYFVILFAHC